MYPNQGYPGMPGGMPYGGYGNAFQQQMMQQRQQPHDGLIRVTGMDGARAYQMPANSSAALFDSGQDVFYVKTTDGAGFPTIRAFSFTPLQEQHTAAGAGYVTREEFDAFKEAVLQHGQQLVSTAKPGAGAE